MSGLSTTGSISFGIALVAGRKRVPSPATGKTALRTGLCINPSIYAPWLPRSDFMPIWWLSGKRKIELDIPGAARARAACEQRVGRLPNHPKPASAAAAGDRHNLVAVGESGRIEARFLIPKDQRDRPAAGPPVSYGPPPESGTDDVIRRAKLAESGGERRTEYLDVFKPSFRHAIAGIGR